MIVAKKATKAAPPSPTKEIKAPNKINAHLIEEWRSQHPTELFPEEKIDLIYFLW